MKLAARAPKNEIYLTWTFVSRLLILNLAFNIHDKYTDTSLNYLGIKKQTVCACDYRLPLPLL